MRGDQCEEGCAEDAGLPPGADPSFECAMLALMRQQIGLLRRINNAVKPAQTSPVGECGGGDDQCRDEGDHCDDDKSVPDCSEDCGDGEKMGGRPCFNEAASREFSRRMIARQRAAQRRTGRRAEYIPGGGFAFMEGLLTPRDVRKAESRNECDKAMQPKSGRCQGFCGPERVMGLGQVMDILADERSYQKRRWGQRMRMEEGPDQFMEKANTVGNYLVFIDYYLWEAKRLFSTQSGDAQALDMLRKVATLCVACAEYHGLPARAGGTVVNGHDGLPT